MKNRYLILIVFINYIIQTSLLSGLRVYGVIPNTALIIVVLISLLMGMEKGLVVALSAGLLQDLFVSKALGIHVMIYCITAVGIGFIEYKLFKDNRLTPSILMLGATLLFYGMLFVIVYFGREAVSLRYIMTELFPKEAIANIVICLIVYRFSFKRLYRYGMR